MKIFCVSEVMRYGNNVGTVCLLNGTVLRTERKKQLRSGTERPRSAAGHSISKSCIWENNYTLTSDTSIFYERRILQ